MKSQSWFGFAHRCWTLLLLITTEKSTSISMTVDCCVPSRSWMVVPVVTLYVNYKVQLSVSVLLTRSVLISSVAWLMLIPNAFFVWVIWHNMSAGFDMHLYRCIGLLTASDFMMISRNISVISTVSVSDNIGIFGTVCISKLCCAVKCNVFLWQLK